MHRLSFLAAVLAAVACAAPIPSPTPAPSIGATATPTVEAWIIRGLEGWTPACVDVDKADCFGVAELFVNNLARNWLSVQQESGGTIYVTARPGCPPFPGDLDHSFCWQAAAPVAAGQVCMVIARQNHPVAGFNFGQVGGDEMAGLGVPPGYSPEFPCI